ncbi:hypothetical protein Tco_0517020 [Tanacetum coccineum]
MGTDPTIRLRRESKCLVLGFPSISVTLVVVGVGPLSGKGPRIIVFADASVLPREATWMCSIVYMLLLGDWLGHITEWRTSCWKQSDIRNSRTSKTPPNLRSALSVGPVTHPEIRVQALEVLYLITLQCVLFSDLMACTFTVSYAILPILEEDNSFELHKGSMSVKIPFSYQVNMLMAFGD